jgi:hypothetical protein
MKLVQALALAAISCVAFAANASDGVFDRSEEIRKYTEAFTDGPRGVLGEHSKEIYISGLSDPVLAQAVRDRLLKEYKSIEQRDRVGLAYLTWTTKALASFGIEEHRAALLEVDKHKKLPAKAKGAIDDEIDRFAWHKRKNEIMASTRNHSADGNPRASRYLNLIKDDDFTYKFMGADRINWEKLLEPRVLDEMAAQLVRYKDTEFPSSAGKAPTKTLGLYAKLLGHSGQRKYQDVLQQVVDSKSGVLVKKHAKEALQKLE